MSDNNQYPATERHKKQLRKAQRERARERANLRQQGLYRAVEGLLEMITGVHHAHVGVQSQALGLFPTIEPSFRNGGQAAPTNAPSVRNVGQALPTNTPSIRSTVQTRNRHPGRYNLSLSDNSDGEEKNEKETEVEIFDAPDKKVAVLELDNNENFKVANFIMSSPKKAGGYAVFTRENVDSTSGAGQDPNNGTPPPPPPQDKETIRRLRGEKADLESRNQELESRNHELESRNQELESRLQQLQYQIRDNGSPPPTRSAVSFRQGGVVVGIMTVDL